MLPWKRWCIASLLLGAGTVAGCASEAGDQPIASSNEALLSPGQYLYLTCNATGWNPSDSNRLKPTSDPSVFTLEYQVTQPWQVSSPDQCQVLLTNQLNGYGTSQSRYSDSKPSTPLVVPASDRLLASTANFPVKYPATGTYDLSLNWDQKTFTIAPPSNTVGDCGFAPKGSTGEQVDYVLAYESATTRWCVDRDFWQSSSNRDAIGKFYGYGDAVYSKLQTLFNIHPSEKFVYQVYDVTGGAHTGSDFGLGVSVTGDAFGNVYNDQVSNAPVAGFWGYLLTLHEAINDFTALVTPGWPSDWWADHRSPFPNTLDYYLMRDIGTDRSDATLLAAAKAHHERFADPSQPGYDPEVGMFESLYSQYGGYSAFTSAFSLVEQDGINWDDVDGHVKPAEILTEYVIAYLQLGIHTTTDLTQSLFLANGVSTLDTGIGPYPVNASVVKSIATAHCSIRAAAAAGRDVSAPIAALRTGNYQNAVATGGTQAGCPAECAWTSTLQRCIARF